MQKLKLITALLLTAGVFFSCDHMKEGKEKALNPADLDTTVRPQEDFYLYANGGWIRRHPLPPDKSRYGTFDELQEQNDERLRRLIDEMEHAGHPAGSEARKISDFFLSGMDTVAIDVAGLQPLEPLLAAAGSVKSPADVMTVAALLHRQGLSVLFAFYGSLDPGNSTQVIAHLGQGGLGMTDRDYYLSDDPRSRNMREAYDRFIREAFLLLGHDSTAAADAARRILALETKLARASMTRLERRDPLKTYHKKTGEDLLTATPGIPWALFFDSLHMSLPAEINVTQPLFFDELEQLLEQTPPATWRDYLTWHVIRSMAPYLSAPFEKAHFEFYGRVVRGAEVMEPRWKRVLHALNDAMGEALGKMYVERFFPPRDKEAMVQLVTHLKEAFAGRIRRAAWMSDTTREKALEKLKAMNFKIGYPDKWRDYSSLETERTDYAGNILRAGAFNFEYMKDKIGKPRDPDEWLMTPQTVNAYNSPTRNEICFPAGILQPPFYYPGADEAVNYGAIGVVIGHEMTHGFDDKGRLYDKEGNLHDWWSQEDAENFRKRAEVLVRQFDAFVVADTVHADGRLTLGENIADLGGLNIAWDAFLQATAGREQPAISGFTPAQRFFLAYAHIWAQNIRREEILRRTKEDVHSLGRFRVNGPLRNLQPFLDAFNVKPGDPMYLPPEERAAIW